MTKCNNHSDNKFPSSHGEDGKANALSFFGSVRIAAVPTSSTTTLKANGVGTVASYTISTPVPPRRRLSSMTVAVFWLSIVSLSRRKVNSTFPAVSLIWVRLSKTA